MCASELHFLEAVINSQTRTSLAQARNKIKSIQLSVSQDKAKEDFWKIKIDDKVARSGATTIDLIFNVSGCINF